MIIGKLQRAEDRFREIEQMLTLPDIVSNNKEYSKLIKEISAALGKNEVVVRSHSKCLSADVTACFDPNFPDVYEKRNSALLSYGTTMSKFTGSRGKSGTNDASAEFV